MSYGIYSKFDIEQHKATFINYLEVVIDPDGEIKYAVPSHQEILIKIACNKFGWSRDQLNKECPKEYYFDFMTWLCNITGYVSVWNEYIVLPEDHTKVTEAQKRSIGLLRENYLYLGEMIND